MKHFRNISSDSGELCRLFFQIRIEARDVRSGHTFSEGAYFSAEWLDEDDLQWTADMVSVVDPAELEEILPPRDVAWPNSADQKIIRYLTDHYRKQVWRNPSLDLYADPRENKTEFLDRCADVVADERSRELRQIREVFIHRFMQLETRFREQLEAMETDADWRGREFGRVRQLFVEVREELNRWSLCESGELTVPGKPRWKTPLVPELGEQLVDLWGEFAQLYSRINRKYLNTINDVEPYYVTPIHSQLDIVSRGFLWS